MHWTDALRQTIAEFIDQPFQWGTIDCMQFCARYVELQTGRNPARGFDYDTEIGAQRVIASHGGIGGVIGAVLDVQARPGVPIPGDLCVAEISAQGEEGIVMTGGVYNGYCVWTVTEARGLVRVNKERILAAWPAA